MLDKLEIKGLRGFATQQTLQLALPNEKPGSGLTIVVGSNNAGKSTVVEALRALSQGQPPSFSQGRRNQAGGDAVSIQVTIGDKSTSLKSIRPGSSETEIAKINDGLNIKTIFTLPSRRMFNPYFSRGEINREGYMDNFGFPSIRSSAVDQFAYRLFAIEKKRAEFDQVLAKVLNPVPAWTIDQLDTGQYFLKFTKEGVTHSSEGLGEGLVSLFFIIDVLYDSKPGDTIAIDEPELSLHPALQRKLSSLLVEYAATRQIIVATHSPYFVSLEALHNGATIARVHIVKEQSRISQLTSASAKNIGTLSRDQNNPHIFGLNAQEIFFVEDGIILVEGQEDIVFFGLVQESLGLQLNGSLFGWGVGGADKMEWIANVLHDLGFAKVVGILDNNKKDVAEQLATKFSQYHFFTIPADDVRTKKERTAKLAAAGLLDDQNKTVRPEYVEETKKRFAAANRYLGEVG